MHNGIMYSDKTTSSLVSDMYLHNGVNYKNYETSQDRKENCNKILANLLSAGQQTYDMQEDVPIGMRRRNPHQQHSVNRPNRKRKRSLSPETIQRRAAKRQQRIDQLEEKRIQRKLKKEQRLIQMWKDNNYTSLSLPNPPPPDQSEDELKYSLMQQVHSLLHYVVGDATDPLNEKDENSVNVCKGAIILNCADNSGKWSTRGFFRALSSLGYVVEDSYTQAKLNNDLHVGDAHLVCVYDSKGSSDVGSQSIYVCHLIAQSRNKQQRVSAVKLAALSSALEKVRHVAQTRQLSVHLPRIGTGTKNFNWYGIERLLRKTLSSKGVPTYVYYYDRHQRKRKNQNSNNNSNNSQSSCSSSLDVSVHSHSHSSASSSNSNKSDQNHSGSKSNHQSSSKNTSTHQSSSNANNDTDNKTNAIRFSDFFESCSFYLHEKNGAANSMLGRYIMAYGGDLCDSLTSGVTHIVTNDAALEKVSIFVRMVHVHMLYKFCLSHTFVNDFIQLMHEIQIVQDLLTFKESHPKVKIVSVQWVHNCVKQQRLVLSKPVPLKNLFANKNIYIHVTNSDDSSSEFSATSIKDHIIRFGGRVHGLIDGELDIFLTNVKTRNDITGVCLH